MTELEQLNKRIEQLTELVKTGSEAIKSMEAALETAEKERDRLADQQREQEPKYERVKEKEKYYYINFDRYVGFVVSSDTEIGHPLDKALYDTNNYYHTEQRAQEVVDKINLLLKLERLHDTFCPDYVPDWNNLDAFKYTIIYNIVDKSWYYNQTVTGVIGTCAYFPTRAIAKKVCDILNAERNEGNDL